MSRILGWAWDTRLTLLQGIPASVRVWQVPAVAYSSTPISSKPRAMEMLSSLSSSLTVMMIRPPFLGARIPEPLKALSRACG